jgi:hypothetical protein
LNIEIGGGTLLQPGWINLDPNEGDGPWKRYAQDTPWPVNDQSVNSIRASHVMEHIPAGEPRIAVMNEAHRVLVPSGLFEIRVPNALSGTWHAFADPTHVSFWCVESFHYFDGLFLPNATTYGIKRWATLDLRIQGDNEILWIGTPA